MKALDYFKEGAKKGNYQCFLPMARLFSVAGKRDDAVKCLKFFVRDRAEKKCDAIENELNVNLNISIILVYNSDIFLALPQDIQMEMTADFDALLQQVSEIKLDLQEPGCETLFAQAEGAESILTNLHF